MLAFMFCIRFPKKLQYIKNIKSPFLTARKEVWSRIQIW